MCFAGPHLLLALQEPPVHWYVVFSAIVGFVAVCMPRTSLTTSNTALLQNVMLMVVAVNQLSWQSSAASSVCHKYPNLQQWCSSVLITAHCRSMLPHAKHAGVTVATKAQGTNLAHTCRLVTQVWAPESWAVQAEQAAPDTQPYGSGQQEDTA